MQHVFASRRRPARWCAAVACLALFTAGCGSGRGGPSRQVGDPDRTLAVGAIPDQDPQELQRRYGAVSDYLKEELGVDVRYVPVTDYTASVTAFRRGDLDLVFFGGLTGVQARLQTPGARVIAQRDIDARFRSVFIAGTGSGIDRIRSTAGLRTLAGHSFTFGSESSTSGRLMPQRFLMQAGVELDGFAGQVGFSNSHDTTIKLVEAGTYDAGVLNAAVWDSRTAAGEVDLSTVREVFRSEPYHDYHWLIRPDVDDHFGGGFTQRVTDALLALDGGDEQERQVLALFQAESFIASSPENYTDIEDVARTVGLLG